MQQYIILSYEIHWQLQIFRFIMDHNVCTKDINAFYGCLKLLLHPFLQASIYHAKYVYIWIIIMMIIKVGYILCVLKDILLWCLILMRFLCGFIPFALIYAFCTPLIFYSFRAEVNVDISVKYWPYFRGVYKEYVMSEFTCQPQISEIFELFTN